MNKIDKAEDIEQLIYRELPPDRYCYIHNFILEKDKEIERLKEENKVLNSILEIQRKRQYHSKFLKDFQKENGKNVLPDFDEIYKRYDNYKDRIDKAIEYIKNNACYDEETMRCCDDLDVNDCDKVLDILRGEKK